MARHAPPCGHALIAITCSSVCMFTSHWPSSKKHLCSALTASFSRSSGTTSEMFTLDAPCDIISTWMPSRAITEKTTAITELERLTSAMSVTIECPLVTRTSAQSERSRTMALSSCEPFANPSRSSFGSSIFLLSVSETETSDEAITSTESLCVSKVLKTCARKPYWPSMRVDVMSTICTPDLDVIAETSGCSAFCRVMSVPCAVGLYEFITRTGMSTRIAGCIATGCRTCAPK
mmetsp:Transcript_19303/g.60141  ORF Transcript_19303/g.60141 Transcript_19303/m.60141 type:complete len:234 (+) Transcript_19303:158-859(+)